MALPNIIFAFMINKGLFATMLAGQMSSEQLNILKETVLNQSEISSLLGMAERFFAIFMQIFFSLFVLLAVVKKKFSYVTYAILIHAVIDFSLVFFQTGYMTNIWIVEGYLASIGVVSMVLTKRMKKGFQ